MQAGNHIPSYLLLERFAKGRDVLDLCAPDEQGVDLLLPIANSVTLVQHSPDAHSKNDKKGLQRVVADVLDLPFRPGGFDMVLALNMDCHSETFSLEETIQRSKALLSPAGIGAFLVPNVSLLGPGGYRGKIPDFLDLERLLRRYFPHLMMFAQQPLYGATLSPIGRRVKEDAPLLDDRMLPEEGETPDFFVALCSAKYHRLDDTVIAQLPFFPMAEGFRLQIEKYEGSIRLIQAEKKARDKKLEQLTTQIDELNERLLQAELEVRDRASLVARVAYLDEQLLRKEAQVAEAEQKAAEKSHRHIELEESVLQSQRIIRRLEQQISDLERTAAVAHKEREEQEKEREAHLVEFHALQSELKYRQRMLDEQVEEVASREAELALLRKEIAQIRETLHQEREARRLLSIQVREQDNHAAIQEALEKEVDKFRAQSMAERHRLEQQFEDEHRKLLDEISVREEMRRRAHLLEIQVKELELSMETDRSRADAQTEELNELMQRLEELQHEKKEFYKERREYENELEMLHQKIQNQTDGLERAANQMAILATRAEEAETRSRELQHRVTEIQSSYEDAEQRCRELQLQAARLRQVEEKYSEILTRSSQLEEALALAEGRSRAAAAHKVEHLAELEERYTDAMNQVRELKKENQHQEARVIELEVDALRLTQLEQRHRTALLQIEELQTELEKTRPILNSALAIKEQAEAAELKYLEEQSSHQKTRAMLLDIRGKASKQEAELAEEQLAHHKTRQELQATSERIAHLESDLTTAMGALAEREEGAEQKVHTAAEKVRHLRNELLRLRHENETELLCVREDLETELRHSLRRLEQAQQEVWELREEVIRLKAQSAATAAAAVQKGINEDFQKTLIEQEILIETMNSEREMLRSENEQLKKSLLNRKKNIRILTTLLRREHQQRALTGAPSDASFLGKDIRRLIESEGGDISEDMEFLDEPASLRASRMPPAAFSDDEVVDAIMESVIVNRESMLPNPEQSMHMHIDAVMDEVLRVEAPVSTTKMPLKQSMPPSVPPEDVIDNTGSRKSLHPAEGSGRFSRFPHKKSE